MSKIFLYIIPCGLCGEKPKFRKSIHARVHDSGAYSPAIITLPTISVSTLEEDYERKIKITISKTPTMCSQGVFLVLHDLRKPMKDYTTEILTFLTRLGCECPFLQDNYQELLIFSINPPLQFNDGSIQLTKDVYVVLAPSGYFPQCGQKPLPPPMSVPQPPIPVMPPPAPVVQPPVPDNACLEPVNTCPVCYNELDSYFERIYCMSETAMIFAMGVNYDNTGIETENGNTYVSFNYPQTPEITIKTETSGQQRSLVADVYSISRYGSKPKVTSSNSCYREKVTALYDVMSASNPYERRVDLDCYIPTTCRCKVFDLAPGYGIILSKKKLEFNSYTYPLQLTNDYAYFPISGGKLLLPRCGGQSGPYQPVAENILATYVPKPQPMLFVPYLGNCPENTKSECPECHNGLTPFLWNNFCKFEFAIIAKAADITQTSMSYKPAITISRVVDSYQIEKLSIEVEMVPPSTAGYGVKKPPVQKCRSFDLRVIKNLRASDYYGTSVPQEVLKAFMLNSCSCHFTDASIGYALILSKKVPAPTSSLGFQLDSEIHIVCLYGTNTIPVCPQPYQPTSAPYVGVQPYQQVYPTTKPSYQPNYQTTATNYPVYTTTYRSVNYQPTTKANYPTYQLTTSNYQVYPGKAKSNYPVYQPTTKANYPAYQPTTMAKAVYQTTTKTNYPVYQVTNPTQAPYQVTSQQTYGMDLYLAPQPSYTTAKPTYSQAQPVYSSQQQPSYSAPSGYQADMLPPIKAGCIIPNDPSCPTCFDTLKVSQASYCAATMAIVGALTGVMEDGGTYSSCDSGLIKLISDVTPMRSPTILKGNMVYSIPSNCHCNSLYGSKYILILVTDAYQANPHALQFNNKVELYPFNGGFELPACKQRDTYARSAALPEELLLPSVDKELRSLQFGLEGLKNCPGGYDSCPKCSSMDDEQLKQVICSKDEVLLVSQVVDAEPYIEAPFPDSAISVSQLISDDNTSIIIDVKDWDRARCDLSAEAGNCNSFTTRYYYSWFEEECQPFQYSGCNGNNNNFVTLGECEAACKKDFVCKEGTFDDVQTLSKKAESPKFVDYIFSNRCNCSYLDSHEDQAVVAYNKLDTINGRFVLTKDVFVIPLLPDQNVTNIVCPKVMSEPFTRTVETGSNVNVTTVAPVISSTIAND